MGNKKNYLRMDAKVIQNNKCRRLIFFNQTCTFKLDTSSRFLHDYTSNEIIQDTNRKNREWFSCRDTSNKILNNKEECVIELHQIKSPVFNIRLLETSWHKQLHLGITNEKTTIGILLAMTKWMVKNIYCCLRIFFSCLKNYEMFTQELYVLIILTKSATSYSVHWVKRLNFF